MTKHKANNKTEQQLLKRIPDLHNLAHRNENLRNDIQTIINKGAITPQDWETLNSYEEVHITKPKMIVWTRNNKRRIS